MIIAVGAHQVCLSSVCLFKDYSCWSTGSPQGFRISGKRKEKEKKKVSCGFVGGVFVCVCVCVCLCVYLSVCLCLCWLLVGC